MKKLFFVLIVLLVSSTLFAQDSQELKGPIGLEFGMNKESVTSILKSKQAVLQSSESDVIIFKALKLGSKQPELGFCKFINDKLFEVVFIFNPKLEAKTQSEFDEISDIIENKYGKPSNSFRNFNGIYKDGDGYEMQAVRTGNATISNYWTNFKNESAISIKLFPSDNSVFVLLGYQDGILIDEAVKKQNDKNTSEF